NPISPEQALAVAEKQFTGMLQTVSKPELIVFARDGDARLAYEIVFTGIVGEETPTEMHVFVDARSSELINQWEGIQTVAGSGNGFFVGSVALETLLASGSYQLKDPNRGNQATNDMANKTNGSGKIFLDADNKWASGLLSDRATVGVDAQFGAATTWDFFKLKFGRLGLRNDGVGALSRVHYGRAYNNAYWSDACFCMTYGDGDGKTFNPFASLDVAGHEMSHGLTAMTAKLVYSGESGGLNEATSDIFGTLVEYFANNQKDVPDYLIGEQLYKSGGGKALRYMYNPPLDGRSPGCYSTTLGTLDVHYSSGVANHFFYLLAEGSTPAGLPVSPTCNGSSLSGIGRDAAGAIWYRALTVYMTSSTNYAGARAATLQAARDLFGSTSSQALAVASAWSAVGVN
ncbi:MAG: M4 family metallopeptidase, partial [Silvanigrellaceae bacterium]